MKYNVYILIALFVLTISSCAPEVASESLETKTSVINGMSTSTFKVWGNCEMCKETIEGSLIKEGILSADWSVDTKIVSVTYDSTKITLDQIQKNIASVGYDNVNYKGNDTAYDDLPGCCQYDRK